MRTFVVQSAIALCGALMLGGLLGGQEPSGGTVSYQTIEVLPPGAHQPAHPQAPALQVTSSGSNALPSDSTSPGGDGVRTSPQNIAQRSFSSLQPVGDSTVSPYSRVTMLWTPVTDSQNELCSGTLIDPMHVLTAAHCVYANGAELTEIAVTPGSSNGTRPFGWAASVHSRWLPAYATTGNDASDLGLIALDRPIGVLTGWQGYGHNDSCSFYQNTSFHNPGYPSDEPYKKFLMYDWFGTFDSCASDLSTLHIDQLANHGQSGSGAIGPDNVVYAVLVSRGNLFTGGTTANRIDGAKFAAIQSWINEDTPSQVDLVAMDVHTSPSASSSSIQAGTRPSSLTFVVHNYSSASWTGTVNFSFYLSTLVLMNQNARLIGTASATSTFGPKTSIVYNATPPPLIPADTAPGTYYLGVWVNVADANPANNWTSDQEVDSSQIRVAAAAAPTRVINLSGDLAFGNVPTGSAPTRTLTINNTGNSTLTVSSINYPTGFSGPWNGTIAAGGSHGVTVTFAPTASTTYGGTVSVNSDETDGTNTIAASGTATPVPVLQFSNATYSVAENAGNVNVTVTRSGSSTGAVSALLSTGGGTATANSDYTPRTNYVVSFADGDSSPKTVQIPIINDGTTEPTETFNVTLTSNGTAAIGSLATATISILDDDRGSGPISLSSPRVSPTSGQTTDQFVFRVDYYDPDGTAPTMARLNLDASTYTATLESGTAASGTYRYAASGLSVGSHTFSFTFTNGVDPTATTATITGPTVSSSSQPGRLTITANPNPAAEQGCTVLTATLLDTTGQPMPGQTLSFSTGFPGALNGFPPGACSGPSYQAGTSGTTDAAGQVKKYFAPSNSGNAVISVQASDGMTSTLQFGVSAIPGEVSGSIYVHPQTLGSVYDVEAVLTKGGTPLNLKQVTLTTSAGSFYNMDRDHGATYTDYTDEYGAIGQGDGNGIELRLTGCPTYVVVNLNYPEGSYHTTTTFLCSASGLGTAVPFYAVRTLSIGAMVSALGWSNDGSRLFAGPRPGARLYGYSTSDWSNVFTITDLRHDSQSLAAKSDNTKVMVGEYSGGAEMFDFAGNRLGGPWDQSADIPGMAWVGEQILAVVRGSTSSLDWIKDHGLFWLSQGGSYSTIVSYPTASWAYPRTRLGYNATRNRAAYGMVASDTSSSTVFVHDMASPSSPRSKVLFTDDSQLYDVSMSPSGDALAIAGDFDGITILKLDDLSTFQIPDTIRYGRVEYLGSTGLLAAGDGQSATLKVFDVSGAVVFNPTISAGVSSLAWSEAKKSLAVGLTSGDIIIYGLDSDPPAVTGASVTPASYSRGTTFTVSATITDAVSGVRDASVALKVYNNAGQVIAQPAMTRTTGDLFSGTWNSTGTTENIYTIAVYVEDNAGNSVEVRPLATLNFGTGGAVTPPAITGAVPASSTQIDLTWTDTASNETGFRVERSTDGVTWTTATTLGAGVTAFNDTGRAADTLYYYRVWILTPLGDVCSVPVAVRTPQTGVDVAGPALVVTSHTNGQVVSNPAITLSGTATDSSLGANGVASVTVNGARATGDTASGSATASWSRAITLAQGVNVITIVATDGSPLANATTVMLSLTYQLADATPPALALSGYGDGSVVHDSIIALTGTASDAGRGDNGVGSVLINGWPAVGGSATGAAVASWTEDITLHVGSNTVTVTASDASTSHNTATLTFTITYAPAPTVSAVTPPSGIPAGGTAVTITGTNFVTGATVTIGGAAATNVVVGSSISITATTPAHSAGSVDVQVVNPDAQSATLTGAFTYAAPPPHRDFDGDGHADLVWHNRVTGEVTFWLMNGASLGSEVRVAGPDRAWRLAAIEDFNADGHPDLVWRNTTTGADQIWYMNGTTHMDTAALPAVADAQWQLVAATDFNADGHPDLLWRNGANGDVVVWYMNGAAYAGYVWVSSIADPNWVIAGVDDFNRDGKPDLVWRNKVTGDDLVWYMNGAAYAGYAWLPAEPDTDWTIAFVGDYDADGLPDLVWWNAVTGETKVTYLHGVTQSSSDSLPSMSDPEREPVGAAAPSASVTGDFNADGWPDILWRNTSTGENRIWYMRGPEKVGERAIATVTDLAWKSVAVADFNGDGLPDIVWRNSTTGENKIWLMTGGTHTGDMTLPTIPDANWKVVGVGDFNRDGHPDLAWRNMATGANVIWFLHNGAYYDWTAPPTITDTNWQIVAVGDFNGDGWPDLFWRNQATGQNIAWFLVSGVYAGWGAPPTISDTTWQIAGAADYNHDGKADLLWRNSVTGQNLIWYLNNGSYVGFAWLPSLDVIWKTGSGQ